MLCPKCDSTEFEAPVRIRGRFWCACKNCGFQEASRNRADRPKVDRPKGKPR